MLRSLFVLLVAAVSLVAAPVPKALKAKPTLNGRWELVEQNHDGKDQPNFAKWMWVIDGEQLSFRRPDRGGVYQPSETHIQAALVPATGGHTGEVDYHSGSGGHTTVYRALIELDGDELIVCFENRGNAERPTQAKPGPRVLHFRFKRTAEK